MKKQPNNFEIVALGARRVDCNVLDLILSTDGIPRVVACSTNRKTGEQFNLEFNGLTLAEVSEFAKKLLASVTNLEWLEKEAQTDE